MKTQNPNQAVIYSRVSSRSQEEEGHGLESQATRCRQYAAAKGYEVVAAFPDTVTGGGDFMKRPGMVALLSFLDAQPDQRFIVIFDDLKRFARDTRFHLDLRDAFRKRGASIECLNFRFDDSPEGEFVETIMAAQGALERKQNGRQVAQKMKARMQNGYWIHNPPVGYRYETQKGHGKVLVHNEPLATIVCEALEGYASGRFQSQAEIKRFFESNPAFPRNNKGEITQQRVTDILTQPLYTGYICSENYGLSWLKGQHAPRPLKRSKSAVRVSRRLLHAKTLVRTSHCAVLFAAAIAASRTRRAGHRESPRNIPTIFATPRVARAIANLFHARGLKVSSKPFFVRCNLLSRLSRAPSP